MGSKTNSAELAECMAPLDEDGRLAVRRYWEQVIREEWVPPTERFGWAVSANGAGPRQRREARRAMAGIASAGPLASVVSLPMSGAAGAGSGVAA